MSSMSIGNDFEIAMPQAKGNYETFYVKFIIGVIKEIISIKYSRLIWKL